MSVNEQKYRNLGSLHKDFIKYPIKVNKKMIFFFSIFIVADKFKQINLKHFADSTKNNNKTTQIIN